MIMLLEKKIEARFAKPTKFAVSVIYGICNVTFDIEVTSDKSINVAYSHTDGVLTEADIDDCRGFILESINDGTCHLPMFIPVDDVEDADQWHGVHEFLTS
jgi:hypothetical protein